MTPPALPKDFLRPCLLLLLREQPAHGYELLDRSRALGFDSADPGGLYRTLRRLENEGMVRSAWEPSGAGPQRRIYEITRTGMKELHDRAKALAEGQRGVETLLSRYEEFVALDRGRAAAGRAKEIGAGGSGIPAARSPRRLAR